MHLHIMKLSHKQNNAHTQHSPEIWQPSAATLASAIPSSVSVTHRQFELMASPCCSDPQSRHHSANREVGFSKFLSLFMYISKHRKKLHNYIKHVKVLKNQLITINEGRRWQYIFFIWNVTLSDGSQIHQQTFTQKKPKKLHLKINNRLTYTVVTASSCYRKISNHIVATETKGRKDMILLNSNIERFNLKILM